MRNRVSPVPEGCTLSGYVWLTEAPPLRPPSPHGASWGHRGAQHQTQARQQGGCQANSQQHACRSRERGRGHMVTTQRGMAFACASMSLVSLSCKATLISAPGIYNVRGLSGGLLHSAPLEQGSLWDAAARPSLACPGARSAPRGLLASVPQWLCASATAFPLPTWV